MNKFVFTFLSCAFSANALLAQVSIMKDGSLAEGVSNDGVAVCIYGENTPYYLWDSQKSGEKPVAIGGISAGNGVGGWGTISADGRYVSGTLSQTKTVNTDLERFTLAEKYVFPQMIRRGLTLFMVGKDQNNKSGIIATSQDNGKTWRQVSDMPALPESGLETICFLNDAVAVAGGWNGCYLVSINGGTNWMSNYPKPGADENPEAILSIDFWNKGEEYVGVAVVKLPGNIYKIYRSEDGAESWIAGGTVSGTPVRVSHAGSRFFLLTKEGSIYTSEKGDTWTECYKGGQSLYAASFTDSKTGLVAGDGIVLRTEDAGENWQKVSTESSVNVRAISWRDNKTVYLVGEKENILLSEDAGKIWKLVNGVSGKGSETLLGVSADGNSLVVCGENSTFYHQAYSKENRVYQMGRYDVETGAWTALGDFNTQSGETASGGYMVSADGKNVAGNAYRLINPGSINSRLIATAALWNEEKGKLEDLGSRYADRGRSARIDAVNADGTVAVGWQDERGPWHSTVWRKNTDGTWGEGKYILKDPEAGEVEGNIMRQCMAVSPNGKWVGGSGNVSKTGPLATATGLSASPYIWSEESGVIDLGMLPEAPSERGFVGNVRGVNDNGTVAIGFFATGDPVSPNMYPFIWTKEKGIQNLNTYIKEVLKEDLGNIFMASALSLSPNGRYIAGWGLDENGKPCAMVIDLESGVTSNESVSKTLDEAKVYTDAGYIHIQLPADMPLPEYALFDMQGKLQDKACVTSQSSAIAVGHLPEGVYILNLSSRDGQAVKSYKLSVKY